MQHVLTVFMGEPQSLTRTSAGQELDSKWNMILKVTNVGQVHKRRRDVEPEVREALAPVVSEIADGPASLGQQYDSVW